MTRYERRRLKDCSAYLVGISIGNMAHVRDLLAFNKRLKENTVEILLRLHSLLKKLEGESK